MASNTPQDAHCPIHPIAPDHHCPSCTAWEQIETSRKTLSLQEQKLDLERQLLRNDKKQLRKTAKINHELSEQCATLQAKAEAVSKERDELSVSLTEMQEHAKRQEEEYSTKLDKQGMEMQRLKADHQEALQKTLDAQNLEHTHLLQLQEELERQEETHEEELTELREKHESILEDVKEKSELALQKLREEHESKVRVAGEEHQKVMSNLQEDVSMQQLQTENYAEQIKVLGLMHTEEKMELEKEHEELEKRLSDATAQLRQVKLQVKEAQEAKQEVERQLQQSMDDFENMQKLNSASMNEYVSERKKLERELEKNQRQQRIHLTAAVGNAAVAKSTQAHVENLENQLMEMEEESDRYKRSNEELLIQLDTVKRGGSIIDNSQTVELEGRIAHLEEQQEIHITTLKEKDAEIKELKDLLGKKEEERFSVACVNTKEPSEEPPGVDVASHDRSESTASINDGEAMLNPRSNGDGRHVTEFPYSMESDTGRYTGWVNEDGTPDGSGFFRSESGNSYEGEWKNGKRHGHGVYTWFDGHLYTGSWIDNRRHGHGVFVWADGRMYDGEYVSNLREGKGIYTWPYGARYDGNYVGDKRNGHGVYVYADGRTYSGEYKDEQPHGMGKEVASDGTLLYEGQWAFGDFAGPTNENS